MLKTNKLSFASIS